MTGDAKRKKSNARCPIVGLHSYSKNAKQAILCVSVLLLLWPAGAQNGPSPDQYPSYKNFSPSMAAIIVILIAALFFMGFFSIYIRNCSEPAPDGSTRRTVFGASWRRGIASRGLDQAVIDTFPTFVYSAVKGLKIGNGALECAVCLNEFEDDETLRLIPKCDHVFHPECIDVWLDSHVTCPVCRANLVPQPGETLEVAELFPELNNSAETETQNPPSEEVSIRVVEDSEPPLPPQVIAPNRSVREQPLPPLVVDRNRSVNRNRPPRSRSVRQKLFAKFPRSHSTGHSLVQPGENTDRFTLRLPEDVRKQVMSRAVNRTTSCIALPRESSSRRGYRTGLGEGSSRGWWSYRRPERLDRLGNSERWVLSMAPPFFSRASSGRSPKVMAADGEGPPSVGSTSFRRVDRKGEEAGGSIDSDRPMV